MRTIWKGHIRFSLVTIPIRVYSAVNTEESISFNQLHKEDMGRIGYEKKCKKCQNVVKGNEIVKGFEYQPDEYVIIESEDIDNIKLKSTKVIEIEGFIDSSEVTPALYDSPYFIGPDGEVAAKAYALLGETLRSSNKVGIGKVIIRDREDVVIISPYETAIMMYKIRYPNEVRNITEIPLLNGVKADKEQLKLAKTLVDSMATNLNKIEIKDSYKESLKNIIQAKVEGKEVVSSEEEEPKIIDLMAALKQSLDKAKTEKAPMQKAKGKGKAKTEAKTVKGRKKKSA